MKHLFAACAAVTALSAVAGVANATPLTAGTTVTPSTSTLSGLTLVNSITGTIVPIIIPPATTPTFTANYTSSVYSETSGLLDFVYSFTDNTGSRDAIESLTAGNFGGFTTDVSYVTNGASAPIDAKRNATNGSGIVTFDFSGVAPGSTSDTLIIRTNATAYTNGTMSLQDGSAGTGAGFAPTAVSAAPEPGTWALMLGGVGLIGLMLRGRLGRRRDDLGTFAA